MSGAPKDGFQDPEVVTPELTEKQQEEAEERTSVSAIVVHEAIRHDGEEELQRPPSALAWSGLAAGLSMGFSFVGQALLRTYLPDRSWRPLIANFGYAVGFLIVIVGRQQLFTENTLTAIIPLLARRNWWTFWQVARLWSVVLVANLCGAHLFAWIIGNTAVFRSDVQHTMLALAQEAMKVSFGNALLRGIFAGWLIAMLVWMLAALDSGRIPVIIIMTYMVGLAGLTHIIAGSVEVLFLVMVGVCSWFEVVWTYLIPTLLGNILGGVAMVSAVNYAQVVAGMGARARK